METQSVGKVRASSKVGLSAAPPACHLTSTTPNDSRGRGRKLPASCGKSPKVLLCFCEPLFRRRLALTTEPPAGDVQTMMTILSDSNSALLSGAAATATTDSSSARQVSSDLLPISPDWQCLAEVEEAVEHRLREEWRGCDLYERLLASSAAGSQEESAPVVQASRSVRWPAFVAREARRLGLDLGKASGLLSTVECAWAALGTTLVVWDYVRGSDMAAYENLSGVPKCVCGVVANSRVFEDCVRASIAVATPTEVELLALVFHDGILRLLPTELGATIPDNVLLTASVAGADGRVFFAGSDGYVYEFDYATPTTWRSRLKTLLLEPAPTVGTKRRFAGVVELAPAKIAKRDPSRLRRLATAALPGALRRDWLLHPMRTLGVGGGGIWTATALAIDDARSALYVASADGSVECYDLSDGDCRRIGWRLSVFDAAKSWCERRAQHDSTAPRPPGADRTLISIHAVSPLESSVVSCVCLDDNSTRYYLTALSERDLRQPEMPAPKLGSSLSLLFVRGPPSGASSRAAVALASNGITIFALNNTTADSLLFCAHDAAKPTAFKEKHSLDETKHHTVRDIAETVDRDDISLAKLRTLTAICRADVTLSLYDQLTHGLAAPDPFPATLFDEPKKQRQSFLQTSSLFAGWLSSSLPTPQRQLNSRQPPGGRRTKLTLLSNGGSQYPLGLPDGASASFMSDTFALTAPLPEVATQMWVGERRIAVLTRAGVEEFAKLKPADVMRELILADADLEPMKRDFGSIETCAMALLLACSPKEQTNLKALAVYAFKKLGGKPTLDLVRHAAPTTGGGGLAAAARGFLQQQQDALPRDQTTPWYAAAAASPVRDIQPQKQPQVHERGVLYHHSCKFEPSALCEALYALVARLVRPLWLKPVLWYDSSRQRCSFLLDNEELAAIRGPFIELRTLLKDDDFFAAATSTDLLALASMPEVAWESQSASTRETEAVRRETRRVHKLYRFASRVGCALSLLDVLRRARDAEDRTRQLRLNEARAKKMDGPTVARLQRRNRAVDRGLSKLGRIRLRELACSATAHEVVRDCLRTLTLPRLAHATAEASEEAYEWPEPLANALAESCFLYFNGGDALARVAASHLDKARDLDENRQWAVAEAEREAARREYLKAAAQWRSPRDAIGESSAIRTACEALRRGKCAAAAVACALRCAANYGPSPPPPPPAPSWELALYRGGTPMTGEAVVEGDQHRVAMEACYETALGVVREELIQAGSMSESSLELLNSRRVGAASNKIPGAAAADLALREACALGSKKEHPAWFVERVLAEAIRVDERRLLQVPLEDKMADYLERTEPMLLWRHHVHWRRQGDAAALMERLASTTASGVDISRRIGYLVRAVEAARRAAESLDDAPPLVDGSKQQQQRLTAASFSVPPSKVRQLEETLNVARLQQRCASTLEALADKAAASRRNQVLADELRAASDLLTKQLLSVSELYNAYCSKYNLWELCLATMRATGQSDPKWAAVLWRSIVRRCVPLESASSETVQRLRDPSFWWPPQERIVLDDQLCALRPQSAGVAESDTLFEQGLWIQALSELVSRVGAETLSEHDDSLPALVAILQKLAAELARFSLPPSEDVLHRIPLWHLDAIRAAGVDNHALFDALAAYAAETDDFFEKFLALAAAAHLLDDWSRAAADDPELRPSFAAAERQGADPSHLLAILDREFAQPDTSPDLRALRQKLIVISKRIDAIFSR